LDYDPEILDIVLQSKEKMKILAYLFWVQRYTLSPERLA